MLNSVQIVLMLMSMFSYISEDKRAVVLFLLEVIISYNPDLGRFPITRKTYETVCELYEPLSALGAYREVLLDSHNKPTVMGSQALLRAILMPILDGLSPEELEELRLSAEDGASVLSLPLTVLQAKVKRWTRQSRKDNQWIWSTDDGLRLLNPPDPTPTVAPGAPKSIPSDWASNVKMKGRLASAVLEYYNNFSEVDYAAAPTKAGLKRRGHVKRRMVDLSTSANRFDDICNYAPHNIPHSTINGAHNHAVHNVHNHTVHNIHNHGTNSTTDNHVNNHRIDFKDIPEAWWNAPALSTSQTGYSDTPYSHLELPATPLKRATSVPTFEDIQATLINYPYYSAELPETPLKHATSTPTFEQIPGNAASVGCSYYPPATPLKHAASVPTFGYAAMELPEVSLERATSIPTFEEFDIVAPTSDTYPIMEPPATPLKHATSVPTFEDLTLPGFALSTSMHNSYYSMELPPTPLKRATSVPTFEDIAYAPISEFNGDTPATGNISHGIDSNFVPPSTPPYGLDQQGLGSSNHRSTPLTPLKHITSGPIVESPSGYNSEEVEYTTLMGGSWNQPCDFDAVDLDPSWMPETPLKRRTSSGFDYGMWDMVAIPAPETAPAPTPSEDASGLQNTQIALPPHTPLRRRNGVRNLRAAAAFENVFLAEPSPTTTGRPYSLNAIIDSDPDSGDDGNESMDSGTATWLARGPAQIPLGREDHWARCRARAGLSEPGTPSRAIAYPPVDGFPGCSPVRSTSCDYEGHSVVYSRDGSDEGDDLGLDTGAYTRWMFPRCVGSSDTCSDLEATIALDDDPADQSQESSSMLSPWTRTPSFACSGSSRGTSPTPSSVQTPGTTATGIFDMWAAEWERDQHLHWVSALGNEKNDEDEAPRNVEPRRKGMIVSFYRKLGGMLFIR